MDLITVLYIKKTSYIKKGMCLDHYDNNYHHTGECNNIKLWHDCFYLDNKLVNNQFRKLLGDAYIFIKLRTSYSTEHHDTQPTT